MYNITWIHTFSSGVQSKVTYNIFWNGSPLCIYIYIYIYIDIYIYIYIYIYISIYSSLIRSYLLIRSIQSYAPNPLIDIELLAEHRCPHMQAENASRYFTSWILPKFSWSIQPGTPPNTVNIMQILLCVKCQGVFPWFFLGPSSSPTAWRQEPSSPSDSFQPLASESEAEEVDLQAPTAGVLRW